MKNLVNFLIVFALLAITGCSAYDEDQALFDQVSELQAAEEAALEVDQETNSGGNQGGNPR